MASKIITFLVLAIAVPNFLKSVSKASNKSSAKKSNNNNAYRAREKTAGRKELG
jgi:hypothetical protein